MKRSIPFGKERNDFSLSINSIWWKGLFDLERRGTTFRYQYTVFDEMVYSICKGEGLLFAIIKQYLMKKSIPFGKERDDFSLSINIIWWKVYSIWQGEGWLFAINKQYLMKRSIPFGKERDDFSHSMNSIWWKGLFHLERIGMTFGYQ